MVSTVIFISGLFIRIMMSRKNDVRYVTIVFALLFFLCFQKASNLVIAAPLIILILCLKWKSFTQNSIFKLVSIALILSPLLLINTNNQEVYWKGSYSGTTLLWQLGSQSPTSLDFRNFLDSETNAPDCIYIEAPFQDLDLGIYNALNNCPGGKKYITENLKFDFIKFVVTNPDAAFELISLGVGALLTSSYGNYGNVVAILPKSIYSIVWGEVSPDFRLSGDLDQAKVFENLLKSEPRYLYSPLLLLGLFTVFVGFSNKFTKLDRRRSRLFLFVLSIAATQIAFTFLLLPSEWFRQSSPYLVLMLIISAFLTVKKVFEE
jgi:hypothetical protein